MQLRPQWRASHRGRRRGRCAAVVGCRAQQGVEVPSAMQHHRTVGRCRWGRDGPHKAAMRHSKANAAARSRQVYPQSRQRCEAVLLSPPVSERTRARAHNCTGIPPVPGTLTGQRRSTTARRPRRSAEPTRDPNLTMNEPAGSARARARTPKQAVTHPSRTAPPDSPTAQTGPASDAPAMPKRPDNALRSRAIRTPCAHGCTFDRPRTEAVIERTQEGARTSSFSRRRADAEQDTPTTHETETDTTERRAADPERRSRSGTGHDPCHREQSHLSAWHEVRWCRSTHIT